MPSRPQLCLHILPPAFALPSLDPASLAATALLHSHLPPQTQWTLVPCPDPSLRPPFLQICTDDDTSPTYIYGLPNIAQYITTHHPSASAPKISTRSTASATALTTFLRVKGRELLDLYLFTARENYTSTCAALTKVLPAWANYTTPSALRRAARRRTEYLGISGGEVEEDDVHEYTSERPPGLAGDVGKEKGFEAKARERASLLLPRRETLGGLLRRGGQGGAVFKLHTLAENVLGTLEDFLGEQEFFFRDGDGVSVVDCEVYGYLALMLRAEMKRDWLAGLMKRKFARLVRFVERVEQRLQMRTDVDVVMAVVACKGHDEAATTREAKGVTLPWTPAPRTPALSVARTLAKDLLAHLLPSLISRSRIVVIPSKLRRRPFWRTYLPTIALTLATMLGAAGYYALTTGAIVWPHGQDVHIFGRRRLADYGHLGAALAGLGMLGREANVERAWEGRHGRDAGPGRVEVEVDGEGVR